MKTENPRRNRFGASDLQGRNLLNVTLRIRLQSHMTAQIFCLHSAQSTALLYAAGSPSTLCHASRQGLPRLCGDTVEVVARSPVLAPPDPTNIPSPPSLLPFPPTHHSHRHSTSSLLFSSPSFPPFPLPSLPVPCLLSLTPPEAKQRPVIAPRNTWYDRPDPPP